MVQMTVQQDPLRLAAAVILGIITGSILFLIIAIVIGLVNDMAHMNIPISMIVWENLFSLVLLAILIITCVAAFWWKVMTTPPSEPEPEQDV